jgi:RNA polymerase sigma factor (sigma-70 family)
MGKLLNAEEEHELFSRFHDELVPEIWWRILRCDELWGQFSYRLPSRSRQDPLRQIARDPGGRIRIAIQDEFAQLYPEHLDCPKGCCLALARLVRFLNALKKELVEKNLGLAHKIALKYGWAGERLGLEQDDLAQWARIGLCDAVERFDPHRGTRFSTYGVWWIRHAVRRAIDNAGLVRVPVCQQRAGKHGFARPAISLDSPINEEEGESTYLSLIPDEDTTDAHSQLDLQADLMGMLRAIEALGPREQQIIRMRYGLRPYGRAHTLGEIGDVFRLSRERIRQLEVMVLRRLRTRLLKAS